MSKEMFSDKIDAVGSKSRWTLPISILAHVAGILAIIIAPILADSVLPTPHFSMNYEVSPVKLPKAPPPPPKSRPESRLVENSNFPPVVAPTGITEEKPGVVRNPDEILETGDGFVPGGDPLPEPTPPQVEEKKPEPKQAPVVVGGNIKPPTRTQYVAPVYPTIAQSARVQGVVILQATIDEDGRVMDVKVLRSIPLLDSAAIDAVRQWNFSPTSLNGKPVAVLMTVTVNFSLQ